MGAGAGGHDDSRWLSAQSMEKLLDPALSQPCWHTLTVLELEDVSTKPNTSTTLTYKAPKKYRKIFFQSLATVTTIQMR